MLTIALMENNKFRLLTDLPGTSPSLHEDFDDFGSLMRMLKAESKSSHISVLKLVEILNFDFF